MSLGHPQGSDARCETCAWFRGWARDSDVADHLKEEGECRAALPMWLEGDGVWPTVSRDDWCLHWKDWKEVARA